LTRGHTISRQGRDFPWNSLPFISVFFLLYIHCTKWRRESQKPLNIAAGGAR
jgi:hypothetical protein